MSDGDIHVRLEIEGDDSSAASRKRETPVEVENRQLRMALASERERVNHIAQAARVQIVDREFDTIVSGIAAAQAEADQAETQYARSMEEGQFAAAAKAQRAMSVASARMVELEGAKAHLEYQRQNAQQQYVPQRPQVPADPVEAMAANSTPRSAAWIRSHRDQFSTPRGAQKVFAAHNNALAEGIEPDTDAYFDHVETFIGMKGGGRGPPRTAGTTIYSPKAGSDGGPVRLTKGEALAATDGTHTWGYDDPNGKFKRDTPIGIQEFARRKRDMIKQGGWYDKID
jgi:hypothetical protein